MNDFSLQATYGYVSEGTYQEPSVDYSVILPLMAGQQVWVAPFGISGMQGVETSGMDSWFSGHLLYALQFTDLRFLLIGNNLYCILE